MARTSSKKKPVAVPPKRGVKPPPPKRRGWKLWFFLKLIKLGFWSSLAAAMVLVYVWFSLDQKGLLVIPQREPGIRLLADNGEVLAEKGAFDGDEVILDALPEYVPQAILAIEDRRFYEHHGIDPRGLARAVVRTLFMGRREGGSTLTQQLAKNLFLTSERTATRKLQEAVLAIWLEQKFSKDEILQLYLNRVTLVGSSLGIERAAQQLYSKPASELTLWEAASLAGVLKAPTTYNPVNHPEASAKRARLVLGAMEEEGYISSEDIKETATAPKAEAPSNYIPAKQYAVDWIVDQLPNLAKKYDQSIIIETTIDPVIQANAEASLRKRLTDNGKKMGVAQGAIVVLDTKGAVKAMVGGRSYKRSQYNRATSAKRQPGSTFKPFVYLSALERGLNPEDIEIDEPVRIGNWSPENYKRKYQGPVSLEKAFAQSLNSVAAKLARDVGPENVALTAQRLGISSPLSNDASIALGTSEVSLLELTNAFVPFANGGKLVQPHVVTRISTRDGEILYERLGSGLGQAIGERELGMMNQLFRSVIEYGTAKQANFPDQDIGGKTGTSQDYRDAWFVGFSSYLVAGVWMGNDDNSPTKNLTGGSLPATVWKDVMQKAHRNLQFASLPGNRETLVMKQTAEAEILIEADVEPPQEIVVERKRKKKRKTLIDILFGDPEGVGGVY